MKAGLGGPDRDVEAIRYLGQRQIEVVVEDEHGPLLEGQPPEGSFELVPILDGERVVGAVGALDRQDSDLGRPAPSTPGLRVTGIGQDPVEPGLEAIRVTERAELPPGRDERGLDGVRGEVGVAQDPTRDRHALVADRSGEGVEGLFVAPLRPIDERSLHSVPP